MTSRRPEPKVNQSGDRSRTGALSKAVRRALRWARWKPPNTPGVTKAPGTLIWQADVEFAD